MLSAESSAEPGQWRTDRAPYLREPMDAIVDPLTTKIVLMFPAQSGKTEVINNVIGYYIDQDPAPILLMEPTLEIARAWSKDRFAPMLRDTPALRGKVKDPRSRDSGNTQLHKIFDAGHITMCGANSPASLASRPIRIVLLDEIDRYPPSAGSEGDPVKLAEARARTFLNRKIAVASTPTTKGMSRIEAEFETSDQRKFWVPCPHCGAYQIMMFKNIKWPKGEPENAAYYCAHCSAQVLDRDKPSMLAEGEWRAEGEFKGVAGFWINGLYSPWLTFAEIAAIWAEAKRQAERGNIEPLKVAVNTVLTESFIETGDTVRDDALFARREPYGPEVPEAAVILTAGVDIQDDRIEVQVDAFGPGEERWNIDHRILWGDTSAIPHDPRQGTTSAKDRTVWDDLDDWLLTAWEHESGATLPIACACVDSGHRTDEVYRFVRPRQKRRVFAVKGLSIPGRPIVARFTLQKHHGVKLFPLGVDTAKQRIYARLKVTEPGPGYMHFPMPRDEEYFRQLTSEQLMTKYYKGHPRKEWILPPGMRNEALDITVYALAALYIINPDIDRLAARLKTGVDPAPPRRRRIRSRGVER